MVNLTLSPLDHTWLLDLDGTIVRHNGYKLDGGDTLLEGAAEFLQQIPENDFIIIITSRKDEYRERTLKFLKENNIRYNNIIWNVPYGERIIINDKKPSGLLTAFALNMERDNFESLMIEVDQCL